MNLESVPSVVDLFAKSGFQREFNFEIKLPDMGYLSGILVGVYCQSIKFGQYNIQEITKVRHGAKTKGYAGPLEIQSATCTFLQPFPDIVSMYFSKWKNLMVDSNGFYSSKANYAKTIYVVEFDRTSVPAAIYKLTGAFQKTFPAHSLSSESEQVAKFEIEFHVDDMEDILEQGVANVLGGH